MTEDASRGLTLANKITISRLLLVPVFVACLIYRRPGPGLVIFLLASVADTLDGYLARSQGEHTALGAMLDPMADKLLMFSAYVIMAAYGLIPAWLAITVIGRDIVISAGFLWLYLAKGFVIPAPTPLGRTTTVTQVLSMVFALLVWAAGGEVFWAPIHWALTFLYFLTGTLTAASGIHYFIFVGGRMASRRESPE
jgi:CDP-diacylglycerol--glycerol-3-phosphate 3-phosphatidyltransferase